MGDDSLGRRTRRAKAPVSYAEADESETEAEPPVKRARRTKAGDSAEFDAADPKPAKGKGRKPNAPLAAPEGGLPVNVTAPLSASQAAASPAVAPSPKKKPRSRTNAATSNPDEARAERYRSVPNKAVMDRLKRAKGQSMFVVERKVLSEHAQEFHVLGSVGNIYKVTIGERPHCSCPDFARHAGREVCKHVLLVLVKALKIGDDNPLSWQIAYTPNELRTIFANSPDPAVLASERVRNAYARATGAAPAAATDAEEGRREIAENDDCPVCYDSLSGPAPLEWCRGCGNSLHTACLTQWKTTKRSQGAAVTCVYCRREWVDGSAGVAAGKVMKEGYLNLAAEAGLSGRRDTSTYYHGPRRGGRSSRYDDEFDEEEEDEEEFEGYRYGQRAYY